MTRQVRTSHCAATTIMRHPNFTIGLDDIRAGRPFDCDLEDRYCAYERGRLLGMLMPLSMPLHNGNGKLNPKAVALFEAACHRKLIP